MLSNLTSQLKEQEQRIVTMKCLAVQAEKDLENRRLSTTFFRIVGTQAVFNVLMGENDMEMATKETKDVSGKIRRYS